MTTEYSPRAPHTRTYAVEEDGQTRTASIRVEQFRVDGMGLVSITEELLDQILRRAGFAETTKDNA